MKSASQTPPPKKSRKSSTPADIPAFDPAIAMALLERTAALLERREAALEPLEEFHRAVETAIDEDVRVYWDVRVVYGRDKPLKGVQGSSTMPGLLTEKMLPNAPSMIQQEIVDKIAIPLTAVFMREGEIRNPVPAVAARTLFPDSDVGGDEDEHLSGGARLAHIIAQKEGRNVRKAEIIDAEISEDDDADEEENELEYVERKEVEGDNG